MTIRSCILFIASVFLLAGSALGDEPLPRGAAPLEIEGDLVEVMLDGLHKFLDEETERVRKARTSHWFSFDEYVKSIPAKRERLREIIGAHHPLVSDGRIELAGPFQRGSVLAEADTYIAHQARWPVLEGVTAEGIVLLPKAPQSLFVIALPDADMTPETICGLAPGLDGDYEYARRLAEAGCYVIVPALIDRRDEFSGNPALDRYTNQPHREFIYRLGHELGSHIIGYEVLKVLAAVEWIKRQYSGAPIGVMGYGEGGLIALYSAALDERIYSTMISGHFGPREALWQEPIYRNVWGVLEEFGDAEIAGLIAPRALRIEGAKVPEIAGPPEPRDGRRGAAPGLLETPLPQAVESEFEQALNYFSRRNAEDHLKLTWTDVREIAPGSSVALARLAYSLQYVTLTPQFPPRQKMTIFDSYRVDPAARTQRQLNELITHTQRTLAVVHRDREKLWADVRPKAKGASPEQWEELIEPMRKKFADDVIGAFPKPTMPPNPRMRVVYDEPKFTGYETVLDVWPGVIATGVLLLPKDLKEGERRPVVVCQHGLEGRPKDTIEMNDTYLGFAAKLAERGFIVYAPQNPYIGGDKFRSLQRKANPLGKSLFSLIVGQHQQLLNWLETLPFVDPSRIAFYGLSYGGKTAMRVPAIETRYCLSICSADFNDWIKKNATYDHNYSYVYTGEYEIFEWNLGRTFNYAEMAWLIAPRPFMVERGHYDGVAPDEWVASEYARVKFLYDELGIGGRTEMEVFNGPHRINAEGTFKFLHRHLDWPEPDRAE